MIYDMPSIIEEDGTTREIPNLVFINDWAKPEIEQAKKLGILPESLQMAYQYPISRENFCELAMQVLQKLRPELLPEIDHLKPRSELVFWDVTGTVEEDAML